MNPATAPRTARLTSIAPQFLVDDLDAPLPYYREHLGSLTNLHSGAYLRGARITKALGGRPWGHTDFYVEDADGYIVCFSEETA